LGCPKNEKPCSIDLRRHVGKAERDSLMFDDRLAECYAVLGVGQSSLVGGLRHPHRLRSDADASALQIGESDTVAFAFIAKPVFGGQLQVLEGKLHRIRSVLAHFLFDARNGIARRVCRHDEAADPSLARARIGDRENDRDVAVLAGGDELLDPIENVSVARRGRLGAQASGIGASLRLAEAECPEQLAASHGPEETLLLFVGAEFEDRHAGYRVVYTHDG